MSSRLRKRFRRVKKFSYEDWKNLYDVSSDKTKPLSFTSDLVTGEFTNVNDWRHLLAVSRKDPIARKICVGLSRNALDDWFVVRKKNPDKDAEEELIEHPKNEAIQEEFLHMDAKYWFTQALIGMRTFGSSALVLNYNKHRDDNLENGITTHQIATLDVFTPENMIIPNDAYDEVTGEPDHIKIYPNATNENVTDTIPWDELIWWNVDPKGRSYDGYSALYAVWDLMTYLRESIDANSWSHKKFAAGIWMWYIKGGMDAGLKADLEEDLKDINHRRALVAESDTVEKVEWSGPSASGSTSIIEGADFNLGLIAAGSDVPKDMYTGVSAGAITGSETNSKELYATISGIQSDIDPYVLGTIEEMGYEIDDMIIDWNIRFAIDELQQAQVRLLNAQAAQMEMQAEQGIDPNAISIGIKEDKDVEQEQNTTGVQAK